MDEALERIRVHEPALGEQEAAALMRCINEVQASGNSPIVGEFERAFATRVGAEHALAVTSGSTALHLAFATCGVGPGDEVILPSFTFAPCADMAVLCGARVVFVDSARLGFGLDVEAVEAAITERTRAVLAVHMYGHPCEIDRIATLCEERGLILIEDCAQAIGAEWLGRPVGSFGAMACYSFYANKHITTGEGGMVTTHDPALAERGRWLRNHALDRGDPRPYHHSAVAFNYRMPAFCAAVGLAQLGRLDGFLERRADVAGRYREALAGVAGLALPAVDARVTKHAHWAHTVLFDGPAAPVADALRARAIDTRPLYYPLHLHDAYGGAVGSHPVSEELAERGLVLPSGSALSAAQVDRVCRALRAIVEPRL